jgi:hypothetical protein
MSRWFISTFGVMTRTYFAEASESRAPWVYCPDAGIMFLCDAGPLVPSPDNSQLLMLLKRLYFSNAKAAGPNRRNLLAFCFF